MADVVKYERLDQNGDSESIQDGEERTKAAHQLTIESNNSVTTSEKKERWYVRQSLCCRRSWKAILFGLLVFAVALMISFVITLLVKEPTRPQYNVGVASSIPTCSEMGVAIMDQGGSVVDAAITTMLCVGLINSQNSGIGGGGFMVIYDPKNGSTVAIDFREVAPSLATYDMYSGRQDLKYYGGLSVAVPGELAGMKKAHDMFGRLPWNKLFEPVINISRDGFEMTKRLEGAVEEQAHRFQDNQLFHSWFYNEDGSLKTAGDIIKRPLFSNMLRTIAENGIDEFYNGSIAQEIVEEVQKGGGILLLEDLAQYDPLVLEPLLVNLTSDLTLATPPLPSGGPQLLFIINLLELIVRDGQLKDDGPTQHHLVEAFKYSFSARSQLGDPWCEDCDQEMMLWLQDNQMISKEYAQLINQSISSDTTYNISHYNTSYSPPDHGTSHISIAGPDGMAIAVTTTINTHFGSKLITPLSGIVLNNEMGDFTTPNDSSYPLFPQMTEANFIQPGKRPMSSTCPVIVLKHFNDGKPARVKLVSGGVGGKQIVTANSQAVMRVLFMGETVSQAVRAKRLYHKLVPNVLYYEEGYSSSILDYLRSRHHNTTVNPSLSLVEQVMVDSNGNVSSQWDERT